MEVQGEGALIRLLDEFKKTTGHLKYDCMVGVSGGRDSSFTLWKLVHDYGLRVLAINYANPFTSPQAKANIEEGCRRLGVDLIAWEYPDNLHAKTTRRAMRIWGRNPSSKLIPLVCAHCKTLWPRFFAIAREQGVRLIVLGSNPLETASFKSAGFGGARTYHKLANLPKLGAQAVGELLRNIRYLTLPWSLPLRMYLLASHSSPYIRWRYKDISVVRLFDYLRWDEKEVENTIAENLGWKKSDEVEATWRFDCRLDYVRRVMYGATSGVTELEDLFSKMIREGMITREEALERLAKENFIPRPVVDDVLAGVDLELADLQLDSTRQISG
jgi:hypothetical protein